MALETDEEILNINKSLHGNGVKLFRPKQLIVTIGKAKQLLDWCSLRYTNLNGNSLAYSNLAGTRDSDYCDTMSYYLNFMVEETPPKEKCGDYYKIYGDKGFNAYSHSSNFSIFEMLFHISKELNIVNQFEYSDEFIDIILTYNPAE